MGTFDLDLDALDRVLIAAGDHDIRYYLNGVLFDFSEGHMAGTDGHRLHLYRNRVPKVFKRKVMKGVPQEKDVQMILPRGPLRFAVSSGDAVAKMSVWGLGVEKVTPQVLLRMGDAFVWIRKPIDGKYPDVSRVIPSRVNRPVWAVLHPVMLADSAVAMGKSSQLASKSRDDGVVLDFGRGEVGNAHVPNRLQVPFELHTDDASIDVEACRPFLQMALSASYLQDAADCVTGTAQWRFDYLSCQDQGVMVEDGDFVAVIMNIRGYKLKRMPEPKKAEEQATAEPVASDAQEEPENAPPEPCPGAVAAVVAGLVQKAQESAKKAPKKGRNEGKALESVPADPVAA